ncbi:MAG: substrate-binding domain-containing protein [Alphaproteobacteria bacterium]|nr:substrate-binding domain-containing protein [Alphaproteobacteria bacterium]
MKLKTCVTALAAVAGLAFTLSAAQAASIAVVGGKNDDFFWNKIKKGIDDATPAVVANGGKVNYLRLQTYDNFAPDVVALIKTAISQKVDGLVIPDWVPDAEDPAIAEAKKAGIKIILMNAGGAEEMKKTGAINYVGTDEYTAGVAGGEYFGAKGKKNILCVNTLPGTANIEARCKGIADGAAKSGAKSTQLPLPSSSFGDPTAVAEAIKATLIKDPSIDAVATIGAGDADSAATALKQASLTGKVSLGCFDFNDGTLARIKSGEQMFAIDQQPYLQALLAVQLLAANIDFGTDLPTRPVLTGPGIVDASNIDATLAGVKKGAR